MTNHSTREPFQKAHDEIEYKWLLSGFPEVDFPNFIRIEQAYIKGQKHEIRIRKTVNQKGPAEFTVNAKKGLGLKRKELEYPINRQLYQILLLVAQDHLSGLCTMELELPSLDFKFEIPTVLDKYIIKNVTGDPAWLNSTLSNSQSPEFPQLEIDKLKDQPN
jgi:CYTH domain-containing protein